VDDESTFQTWLAGKPTYAQTAALVAGDPAAGKAAYGVCTACHGPTGQGNQALNAPKLNSQAGWYLARQLRHFKQESAGLTPGTRMQRR